MKNKIGWCTMTFNPCWGCLNHCEYCYARAIAKRFWKQRYEEEFQYYIKKHPDWVWTGDHLSGLKDFRPMWLESKFNKKLPKSPQRIFVGSMSEIYYWEEEWIERVIEKVKQYPQHTFIFLTKYMEVYAKWIWPKNCILGVTITKGEDFKNIRGDYYFYNGKNKTLFCFEPLLGPISPDYLAHTNINWVILGAESGNRKGKIVPKRKWFEEIVYCQGINKIPVYVKDNLTKYYPEYKGHKQFP